jgi:hypothetical protein
VELRLLENHWKDKKILPTIAMNFSKKTIVLEEQEEKPRQINE